MLQTISAYQPSVSSDCIKWYSNGCKAENVSLNNVCVCIQSTVLVVLSA
jgi:hypothetical protein